MNDSADAFVLSVVKIVQYGLIMIDYGSGYCIEVLEFNRTRWGYLAYKGISVSGGAFLSCNFGVRFKL